MHYTDWSHTPERKKKNEYGGIGYYRCIKVAEQIKDHEVTVVGQELMAYGDTSVEQWDNIFKEYDVFWCQYFADDKIAAIMFYHAIKHGKKVIIDVDDNYFDVPKSNLLYSEFKEGEKKRAFLSAILSLASAVTVSTEPLKEKIESHIKERHGIDKPVFVIPNFNDINDWNYKPLETDKNKIVIGYTGSNSHLDDLAMVIPNIRELMKKYSNLHFEILGIADRKNIKTFLKGFNDDMLQRIALVGATNTFKEYPQWLSQRRWDIGIAPLVDTAFTRCKSHIKWMEYSMFKIPTVVSRVYPYFMELKGRDTVIDGETGFVAKEKEWVDKLTKLIESKELREKIGQNAYDFIKDKWQYKDSGINEIVNELIKVSEPVKE